jgi:hypothetical protein
MRRALVVVVPLLLLLACAGSDVGPTTPIDTMLTVGHGQTMSVADSGGLAVRFDAVSEDSRCPMNAMCVSAGRAVARVSVIAAAGAQAVDIASDPVAARAATAHGVRVEWQQLLPYPFAGQPTAPADYRLTVRVVR